MSSLMRWEPFEGRTSLQQAMRQLFESSVVEPGLLEPWATEVAMDVYEKDNNVIVKVSLPGVKPEDVQVTLVGDTLTITGETKAETNVEEKHYVRRERRYGQFSRTVTLPGAVAADNIQAEFEHGVLTITVPKPEEEKTKKVQVKTK